MDQPINYDGIWDSEAITDIKITFRVICPIKVA